MIYFEVKRDGQVLSSNLSTIPPGKKTSTYSKALDGINITIAVSDSDSNILASRRHTQAAMAIIETFVGAIVEAKQKLRDDYTILSHNLISTHSHLQDTLESIVPEKSLVSATDHTKQVAVVQDLLGKDLTQTSKVYLDILKRVVDLQAQIEGIKILSGARKQDIGEHNILKVIQNVIHPFYSDLLLNNVSFKWHIDPDIAESKKLKTDYKALNVILHHLFTNAVKYAKPYSCIDINFDLDALELSFSMKSIRIEKDELLKIFDLGYCGKNVPSYLAGEGVGMYMVKKATELLGMEIIIAPDYSAHVEDVSSIKYCPNKFILKGFKLA